MRLLVKIIFTLHMFYFSFFYAQREISSQEGSSLIIANKSDSEAK